MSLEETCRTQIYKTCGRNCERESKDSNATMTSWYKIVEMGFIGNKLLQSEIQILSKATSGIFSLIQ